MRLGPTTSAASTALRSSRTLPGHGWLLPARERVGAEQLLERSPRAELAREVLDEQQDVLAALAQRRQAQHDDREPVVEVEAEPAVVDLGAEVAVGRGDHARVELELGRAADAAKPPALEHAEQRGLIGGRQLADLVEEHRAAVRALERADVRAIGAGERAALVAEQLAREQRRRRARRSRRDERLRGAPDARVQRLGDALLAGARLADDQHRRRRRARRARCRRTAAASAATRAIMPRESSDVGRARDRAAHGVVEPDRRAAELDRRARRHDRALDPHARRRTCRSSSRDR